MHGTGGDAKGQPTQTNSISHGSPWVRIKQDHGGRGVRLGRTAEQGGGHGEEPEGTEKSGCLHSRASSSSVPARLVFLPLIGFASSTATRTTSFFLKVTDRVGGNARSVSVQFGARELLDRLRRAVLLPQSTTGLRHAALRPRSIRDAGERGGARDRADSLGPAGWGSASVAAISPRRVSAISSRGLGPPDGVRDVPRLCLRCSIAIRSNNWNLSVDDWVDDLALLDNQFKDDVLRRFFYQFVTLPRDRVGEASARYAITYFVRNVFGEPGIDAPDPPLPIRPAARRSRCTRVASVSTASSPAHSKPSTWFRG